MRYYRMEVSPQRELWEGGRSMVSAYPEGTGWNCTLLTGTDFSQHWFITAEEHEQALREGLRCPYEEGR